jgi:hypothetical protein
MVNLTEFNDLMPSNFLAGVNLSMLLPNAEDNDNGSLENSTLKLRDKLWNRHEQQQAQAQKIPPLWQRRQLSLQAAAVLSQQGLQPNCDVLATLTQLVQDLPSIASTLVQVKIPPYVHQWTNALWQDPVASKSLTPGQLFINGSPFSVARPSFNIFELLNVVRMEERRVQNLEKALSPHVSFLTSPYTALSRIQQAWIGGSDFGMPETPQQDGDEIASNKPASSSVFRIDVVRGWKHAVTYVNDCEKDEQYRQWTSSFRQMLMSMQYGMPPSIRRNLYTMTLVIDLTATTVVQRQNGRTENGGLDLAMKLVQNQYPVRLGLVIVDDEDVKKCKAWLQEEDRENDEPCPVEPKGHHFEWFLIQKSLLVVLDLDRRNDGRARVVCLLDPRHQKQIARSIVD